jgi:2-keto-4-pentenoate hydratase/2-oxohepta-3-ene-1,7-dioic acid hydratase in catechol pathway
MRWARIEVDGEPTFAIVEGDQLITVAGTPWGAHSKTGNTVPLEGTQLLPPLMPRTFYCVGLNYLAHILEQAEIKGIEPKVPQKPDTGYRLQGALTGHENNVEIPPGAGERIHYEGELVAVIGKKGKKLTPEQALDCVFGYTIGNDVSARGWQYTDNTMWRGKNSDTFKPMGPWIETDIDLDSLETNIKVNGKEIFRFDTNNMIFGVGEFLSAISQYITLHPGDVLWMGTDGSSPNLVDGDLVEIEINQIGTLRNKYVWVD